MDRVDDKSGARRRRATPRKPWHPPGYDARDVRAIQALARGEAGPDDQRRALDWIVHRAAQTYDEPFYAENARVTDYVLGRRSVGLALVKLIRLKPALMDATPTPQDDP